MSASSAPASPEPSPAVPLGAEPRKRAWTFLLLDALALLLPAAVYLAVALSDLPAKLARQYQGQTGPSGPPAHVLVAPWGTWIADATAAAVFLVSALRLWRSRRLFWLLAIPVLASLWWFQAIRSLFLFQ